MSGPDHFGKNNISIGDSIFIVDTIDSSMIEFAKVYVKVVEVLVIQIYMGWVD